MYILTFFEHLIALFANIPLYVSGGSMFIALAVGALILIMVRTLGVIRLVTARWSATNLDVSHLLINDVSMYPLSFGVIVVTLLYIALVFVPGVVNGTSLRALACSILFSLIKLFAVSRVEPILNKILSSFISTIPV